MDVLRLRHRGARGGGMRFDGSQKMDQVGSRCGTMTGRGDSGKQLSIWGEKAKG